jgi:class 3 adenylate cyclase/CheY-like chemotaxis protein
MNANAISPSANARILVVDDVETNVLLLQNLLRQEGYTNVHTTTDSRTVVDMHRTNPFDLILLDLQMPQPDGMEIMEQLKPVPGADFLPVIVITAFSDEENRLKALSRGARDYVVKPFNRAEVVQRIRNYLEVRMLYREQQRQSEILEQRVREQTDQLERLARLKRFFSPQLAEKILAGGVDDPLLTHRREITAVFVDLRGFTAFTEASEPEEVMEIIHQYHAEMGRLILEHEGTIEFFAGDGIMVIFNDPVVVNNPVERALAMALGMQAAFVPLAADWRKRNFDLGIGIGIAQGYATIGAIGFEGHWDYGVIGTVTNLAARLCGEAKPGQIVVHRKSIARIEDLVEAKTLGKIALKGFAQGVEAVEVLAMRVSIDHALVS